MRGFAPHNKDGTIHAMPIAYRYMNGQILILSLLKSRKNRNIERNNDVTVLVDTPDPLRGVLIYGTAEVDYDNIYEQALTVMETRPPLRGMSSEKLQRFTKAYLDAFKMAVVKVTPKHFVTFNYTKDEAWNNFLKTNLQQWVKKAFTFT